MAAGDVTILELDATDSSAIDTAVTNARVTANDKWMAVPSSHNRILVIHIEEA